MNIYRIKQLVVFQTIILFSCLFGFAAISQEQKNGFLSQIYLGAKMHYGFLIPHHPELWTLTDDYFTSFEIDLLKQTDGRKSWQRHYHYPHVGLSYRYTDFGGSDDLGVSHSVIPFINFPFANRTNFKLDFRIGLGMAYLTKKFDRLENYRNLAIGSHYNAAVTFQIETRFKLTGVTWLNAGVSMYHASNGAITTPNYGLNIPSIYGGIDIKLNRKEIQLQDTNHIIRKKGQVHFRATGSTATKQLNKIYNERFPVYILSTDFLVFYNDFNRILLGYDLIYDESMLKILEKSGERETSDNDIFKHGLVLGHEWVLSDLALMGAFGYYLYTSDKSDGAFYTKIGASYTILDHVQLSLVLKTYYARADYLSGGIGIIF